MKETLIISQMFSNKQQKKKKTFTFLPYVVLIKEKKDPVENRYRYSY